jgi:hypothetical protein
MPGRFPGRPLGVPHPQVIARRPDAAGVRMVRHLPGDPCDHRPRQHWELRVTASVDWFPSGSFVPPRPGDLGSELCMPGIRDLVSPWPMGLTRGSRRACRPSRWPHLALIRFADAPTDPFLPRVIVPWGTSIAPVLCIPDSVGSPSCDERRDRRPGPIPTRVIPNQPNPDKSTHDPHESQLLAFILAGFPECEHLHDRAWQGGRVKTTLTCRPSKAISSPPSAFLAENEEVIISSPQKPPPIKAMGGAVV